MSSHGLGMGWEGLGRQLAIDWLCGEKGLGEEGRPNSASPSGFLSFQVL